MTAFAPSKRLGQNFLVDGRVLDRIVAACSFQKDDIVLEIGPGQGALTRCIAPLVRKLDIVERDPRLLASLQEEFGEGPVQVHGADILDFSLDAVGGNGSIKVVGNIPYYISTPIMERMLFFRRRISVLFMTVQLEFAQRMTAKPGSKDYSAMTCLLDFFTEPEILFRISSRAFRPMPAVESCLLRLNFRRQLPEVLLDEAFFIRLVRLAFSQRRKTILNVLSPLGPRQALERCLDQAGVNRKSRPEDIASAGYARMSNVFKEAASGRAG
jgi:16S rRNA (adenine1518-N6/adenine1519-N6)-dimethyltransferase